jgi:hypothetical protein
MALTQINVMTRCRSPMRNGDDSRDDILAHGYAQCCSKGAPGVDGQGSCGQNRLIAT